MEQREKHPTSGDFLININVSYKKLSSTQFSVSLVPAVSQKQWAQNNPYAKEAWFEVVYSAPLQVYGHIFFKPIICTLYSMLLYLNFKKALLKSI